MSDPVYVIVQMTITDPDGFRADYAQPLAGQLAEYGAIIHAVTPTPRVVEGSYDRNNTVILEFPSAETFDDWYGSDAYAPLKAIRSKTSDPDRTTMLVLPTFAGLPS
ncbi:MAG: DUF1330 domain-containing protein [Pseudomonadota bacterium]